MQQQRQHPRVRLHPHSAALHVRTKLGLQSTNCLLCDVSAEGVGVTLADSDVRTLRGDTLTVSLRAGNVEIEVPGTVAYINGNDPSAKHAGIRLHLAIAGAATRSAWSAWLAQLVTALDPQGGHRKYTPVASRR